jgi:mRNA-degrading endonuclease RelE of RelBE toxin-antitoxin system
MYDVLWEKKAFKQLLSTQHGQRITIAYAVAGLKRWPECHGVKRNAGHHNQYGLRLGRDRVLFYVDSAVRIASIDCDQQ